MILKGHPLNIYLWILKSLKNVSTRGWSGGVQPPLLHSPSLFLTRYCKCVTTVFCFTERYWNVANKDPNRQRLSVKSNFSRVTEITSTMERSQLSLSGKTKRYRKYTLILSFIAFSTTIYGLAIETECKSNPPHLFFIWLLKRCCWFTIGNVLFVLFFFELFAESSTADCCWQVISHSLWELIAFGFPIHGKLC